MTTIKHNYSCVTKSIVFDGNITMECHSANDTDLILPNANGRHGQFLSIIDGHMKWTDPPNVDVIKLDSSVYIKADVDNTSISIDYLSKHDNPHPILLIQGDGDFDRTINYYLSKLTSDQIDILIKTKANIINNKFGNLSGIYRNIKAINSSNGMLIVVYINQDNKVILNKCMTEDGDGYFTCNETDIIVPANVLDIYSLPEKKLGIVHNDYDNNIIFTSCNLPDGNGVKTKIIIDNCNVSTIKLVSTRTETIVISYITTDGYLYYAYSNDAISWQIKMLSNNVKVIGGYLDMISFNGQSVGIAYYNINKELNLVYSFNILDENAWNYIYIDTINTLDSIKIQHLDNNDCLVLVRDRIYYHGISQRFNSIHTTSIIKLHGNQLCLIGIVNDTLYSYLYDYKTNKIISEGTIATIPSIIESQLLYTSTGSLIASYLTDQPGILVSPFDDRFAYDLNVNITCLIK